MIEIRLNRGLYEAMLTSLRRPHSFAYERVGFAVARRVEASTGSSLIIVSEFIPVADEHYIDDPNVGARIGTEALTIASRRIYHGRSRAEGIFHVHEHGHTGEPILSRTDARELPSLIPGFKSVGPTGPHGLIIWSLDNASAWVWLPAEGKPLQVDKISIIGAPISIVQRRSS